MEAKEKFLRDGSVFLKSILSTIDDDQEAREWLVKNVKGIGYSILSRIPALISSKSWSSSSKPSGKTAPPLTMSSISL